MTDYGKKFREMSDRHTEETGEGFFSGSDANGYYFSFGYFPNVTADVALMEAQALREAVPHVIGSDGQRKCPEMYCICSPHPGNQHADNTGATWRTRKDGEAYDVQGHDGE